MNNNTTNNNLIDNKSDNFELESSAIVYDDKKFEALYKKSFKATLSNENLVKDIDAEFLKKIKAKRNEIISLKKKIDYNDAELDKAYITFNDIYYQDVNDEAILDSKDKALAQKTLFLRKSARDIDAKIEKLDKEYNDAVKNNEDELVQYKKSYSQSMMDLEKKLKGEIGRARNAKKEEEQNLNYRLSEVNDRNQIAAINEHLGNIKKELLAIIKDIKIKYVDLKKEEEIKNITYYFENEKKMISLYGEYEKNKSDLLFQKREAEIEYESESKTYILAAKRANNNLKKDLILKKNGVIKNNADLNKDLYEKITAASIELVEMQNKYNEKVLNAIVNEYVNRINLVLGASHEVLGDCNKDIVKLNANGSNPFIESLSRFNTLKLDNLKSIVEQEIDELVNTLRAAYVYNAKAEYKYKEINDKVVKYFSEYKKNVYDNINRLYTLSSKLSKDSIKKIPALSQELKAIGLSRISLYKELMDKVNNTIISFASSSDPETTKYSDDEKVKNDLLEQKAKYFIGDYKNAEDEMNAIDVIHEQNAKKIDAEIESFNSDIEAKRKELAKDREGKEEVIQGNVDEKLSEVQAKYDKQKSDIEEKYREMHKSLVGDFKTENKLI